MIWVCFFVFLTHCSLFNMFLFKLIYNQRTTTVILPRQQRIGSLPNQRKRSLALNPWLGGWSMHHLYISLSCLTWHDHGWYRVVVFSTINIAVTVPTSTNSGKTQHCWDNKTVLLPNYYQYWCSIGIPDFRFSHHDPPELKWQLLCRGDTHTSKVSLCGKFSLGCHH